MKCDQTEQCLLYLWGEMAESESKAFAEHLAGCAACKSEVDQLQPIVRSMKTVQPEQLPENIAVRLRDHLAKAVEARPAKLWFTPRRVLAAAASIILVVSAGILWQTTLNRKPYPMSREGQGVAAAEPVLGEDDYIEALALVWIDDLQDPDEATADGDDVFAAEIEDVSVRIESMLQEVEQELAPDKSEGEPDDGEGSAPRTFGRNATT